MEALRLPLEERKKTAKGKEVRRGGRGEPLVGVERTPARQRLTLLFPPHRSGSSDCTGGEGGSVMERHDMQLAGVVPPRVEESATYKSLGRNHAACSTLAGDETFQIMNMT